MCGIAGEITRRGCAGPDRRSWEPIVDAMWRRGPDASGIWADGVALLGCRRLAVMDPDPRATLPLVSADGRFVLAYNGELYDHRRLRAELTCEGWTFRTTGDAEVVLAALALRGRETLAHLNGIFALAFYDERERRLLLARDMAGVKPLYLLTHPGGAIFASEFELLLETPTGRAGSVDPVAMAAYLRLGHIPAPMSMLTDARMLEPGAWIECSFDGPARSGRASRLKPTTGTLRGRDARDAIETALRNAIRRQVVSDVPVGFFLSGGIDSPLIAALAAQESDVPIQTFSLGSSDVTIDESSDARRYAAAIGSTHYSLELSTAHTDDLLANVVAATKEPLADEGIFPTLAISALAREHVTVVLSGEGADELFFGYVQRQTCVLGGGATEGVYERYEEMYNDFPHATFEWCFPGVGRASGGPWQQAADKPDGLHALVRRCEFERFLPFILLKTDRASMFHSLEVRVPFLDLEVIDAALAVDPQELVNARGTAGKLALRQLLRQATGHETSPKRGFTAPMDSWIRGPLRDATASAVRRGGGLEHVPHDRTALVELADAHFAGRIDAGMALWRLLILDAWCEKVRRPRDERRLDRPNWASADHSARP